MESKICKSCISEYPLSLFNKRTRSIDGYNSLCKKCYKLQRKKKKTDLPTSDITEKLCTTCNTIKNIQKGSKMIDSIINQQKINVEQFLNINPLPTLSGNSIEGTE